MQLSVVHMTSSKTNKLYAIGVSFEFSIFMDGLKDWIMHTNSIMSGEAKNRLKSSI